MKTLYLLIKSIFYFFINAITIARIKSREYNLNIELPTLVRIDDLNALNFGRNIHIGAFSEIVVLKKSAFSQTPGALSIGNRVIIGARANIRAAGGEIAIGNNSLLAQNVSLIAANHLIGTGFIYRDATWDNNRTGVIIGENVWIGANATILPGVKIGNCAIIGAGAVVTRDIPANEIWAGVPAQHLNYIKNYD